MDKQKQIEEMAREFGDEVYKCGYTSSCKSCILCGDCQPYWYAKVAYNAGYRKIPENAVVLTREEYEELQIGKDFNYGYHNGESNMTSYYENIRLPEVRKETAEKFAKRLIANLIASYTIDDDCTIEELEFDGATIKECIDDILKEITEGNG